MTPLTYAVVSPVRDEVENLHRLSASIFAQSVLPVAWIIVDNGSQDGTVELAQAFAAEYPWIETLIEPAAPIATPGAPIVRAFHAGLDRVPGDAAVIVKQDADTSMPAHYFERILKAFEDDPRLGITGGSCYELGDGVWRETHVTGGHVRGASRCYRRACLDAVLPLEERLSWDGIDELKASVLGWRTLLLRDVPFYHHRSVGERDGARTARRVREGAGAYYMGYRPSYLILRAVHHGVRQPTALAMIWGYLLAAMSRAPRYGDQAVVDHLRAQQRLSRVPRRLGEALGKRRGEY